MIKESSDAEADAFLTNIASEQALHSAWKNLNKSNPDSHGVSGVTISDYSKDIENKLSAISQKILAGKFRFSKARGTLIPKDNGKLRPLQIPEIEDRIVLKSIALEIEKHLQHKLKKSQTVSFAYQEDTGIKQALEKLIQYYQLGYQWIFEADIKNFFDKVDKNRLLQELVFPDIPNSPIVIKLIERAMNAGVDLSSVSKDQQMYFNDLGNGIPQGNPLSPLFSNIYLQPFDSYMIEQDYKLIRYADDFIVMVKSYEEGHKCFELASKYLKNNLQLDLHPLGEKSKIAFPEKESVTFLSITFDGKHIFPSLKNKDRFKQRIDKLCHELESRSILEILQRVKNTLDGWVSAFFYTDIDRYFREIDSHINKQLYLALHKRDWKFSKAVRGRVSLKFRGNTSPDCLSDVQRKYSGVPFSKTVIEQRRKSANSNG